MYYKRPRRKNLLHYVFPFAIIGFIFSGVIFAWGSLNDMFIDQNRNTINEKVFLSIETGSAKAMTVGNEEWQNAPDKIYLYRGEKLKTGPDGRATLSFFDESKVRLNTSSELQFNTLKKRNETTNIEVELKAGDAWVEVDKITDSDSEFVMTTQSVRLETKDAHFSLEHPGTIHMLEGSAVVSVLGDGDVLESVSLGVGQQLMIDESSVESLSKGEEVDLIFAMSDTFKKSNWYRWNMKKTGAIEAFEEPEEGLEASEDSELELAEEKNLTDISEAAFVTKPSKNTETNKSSITLEGRYDSAQVEKVYINGDAADLLKNEKWSAKVRLVNEGENVISIEVEDSSGFKSSIQSFTVIYDQTAPDAPVITNPTVEEEGEAYVVDDVEQAIEGTVSEDTHAVIVNDYRLGKYVPGSQEFTYYAKVAFSNLEVGENEYKVIAEDKAGNQSEVTTFYLELPEEVVEEEAEEEEKDSDSTELQTSSSGGVRFTAPNSGESFQTKETEFELKGEVPSETAKVTVNDYQLSQYSAGDTAFVYRAYKSIGNLDIGKKNVYKVKAYDEKGALLGSATMTIDVESGEAAVPVITIPSSNEDYTTSLDTLVIGGTVGKWVTRMYVNDREIREYIPGSEEFRSSVTLAPGENVIKVTAEKQGETVGSDQIKITFQN